VAPRKEHVDLDIFAHLLKVVADTPWLHYGLWLEGETPTFPTLRRAQERYVDKLVALLPPAPASILDIGGGTGALSGRLSDLGYTVEMLTPSAAQVRMAREALGDRVRLHQSRFEDFVSDRTFNVCLFSESFQYIKLSAVFAKIGALLTPGGLVVIADCFRSAGYQGGRMVGGGHRYAAFIEAVAAAGYAVTSDEDVTALAAPSIEIDAMFYRDALSPVLAHLGNQLERRRPFINSLIRGGYRLFVRKRARSELADRLAATYRTPALFHANNTYRFLALRRA
jgi:2-polyprenyl-3-methyl-5-hydroxy-6-metoxy-1,4-benzoquinol methylase